MRADVLDANLDKIAELSDYVTATLLSQATRGGAFTLTAPETPAAVLLRDTPGAQVRFVDDSGRTELAGPVLAYTEQSAEGLVFFEFTGIDNLGRLAWRVTDPQPATANPPWATDAYDTYTGTPVEVIAQIVDDRCGTNALPARQFLTVNTPAAFGSSITVKLRFRETLAELVDRLAVAYGVTVTTTITGSGLEFDAAPAPIRDDAPIGPEIAGWVGYEAGETAPEATVMIVGGQGELTARTFSLREKTAAARWPWRIEHYREHTEIDNQTDLDETADQHLEEMAGTVQFTADVEAFDSDAVRYGRDYGLGDYVPVRVGGQETTARVTATETVVDDSGVYRSLTVGVPRLRGRAMTRARRAEQLARSTQGA